MYKVINETHIQKMPEGPTILRGDSGQWKQDQVLQEGRDFKRKKMHVDADGNPATVYTVGWIWVALPISKPKPIETLFKEAMEDYVHNRYPIDETYTATGEEKQYLKRRQKARGHPGNLWGGVYLGANAYSLQQHAGN